MVQEPRQVGVRGIPLEQPFMSLLDDESTEEEVQPDVSQVERQTSGPQCEFI